MCFHNGNPNLVIFLIYVMYSQTKMCSDVLIISLHYFHHQTPRYENRTRHTDIHFKYNFPLGFPVISSANTKVTVKFYQQIHRLRLHLWVKYSTRLADLQKRPGSLTSLLLCISVLCLIV